jgi:hypothetical protein
VATYTFATGVSPSAATLNALIRDQVISTTTSGARPTGTAGQFIYETDTGRVMVYNGSTWMEFGRTSGGQTWTPQIDQGATTNITKTITTARFVQVGNVCYVWCTLALTGAGTAGSAVTVTLPVTPASYNANDSMGSGHIVDASAGANSANVSVWYSGGAAVYFQIDSTAAAGRWGTNPSIALASGDGIRFTAQYLTA